MSFRIGFTRVKGAGYERYGAWVRHFARDIEIVDLHESAADGRLVAMAAACDGIVFPGGPDIDPARYGMPEALPLCKVDAERDALELETFACAQMRGIPVLGVCRGLQVINVALGGTLAPDLPSIGITGHAKSGDAQPDHGPASAAPAADATHAIDISRDTHLYHLAETETAIVNSSHHQAAALPAPGVIVSARAIDGTIEALEWAEPEKHPWMLCVQWHPERMEWASPLSAKVAEGFLRSLERRN